MLLIPYYTTVFRGQSQNRWYKTSAAMLLNKATGQRHSIFYFTYALLFRYSESTCLLFFCLEMSKQLTLFGTSAKDNKRAGNLINKDPKSKYEKVIERFVRKNKGQASRESVVMSRAPFHAWRLIYENASVCFCPKMPCTNVHCLTPSPPKRPVDVKRGKSEYVDSPLYSSFNGSCGYWGFPASHVAPQVLPWLVVVFQWYPSFLSDLKMYTGATWLVCVFFCFCCSCCFCGSWSCGFRCWCGYNQM